MTNMKNVQNNALYTIEKLHLSLFSFSTVTLTNFVSSIFCVHSSTSGSTNFFLHLQFEWSKYSLILQVLSHSLSQLLGFKINPLSHTPLSINSLHSHVHLSSFHRCLLLQIILSNLHIHLYDSCHFMCLVSLVNVFKLNTLTFKFFVASETQVLAYVSDSTLY